MFIRDLLLIENTMYNQNIILEKVINNGDIEGLFELAIKPNFSDIKNTIINFIKRMKDKLINYIMQITKNYSFMVARNEKAYNKYKNYKIDSNSFINKNIISTVKSIKNTRPNLIISVLNESYSFAASIDPNDVSKSLNYIESSKLFGLIAEYYDQDTNKINKKAFISYIFGYGDNGEITKNKIENITNNDINKMLTSFSQTKKILDNANKIKNSVKTSLETFIKYIDRNKENNLIDKDRAKQITNFINGVNITITDVIGISLNGYNKITAEYINILRQITLTSE